MQWQPIETAPKDGTDVDLWVVTRHKWRPEGEAWRHTDCFWKDGAWREYGFDSDQEEVESEDHTATHWMPVPAPPTN